MIEINLVPDNLRKKKKQQLLGGFNIPPEIIIGLGGGLIVLLVFVHLGLLFVNMSKLAEHKELKKEWDKVLPNKQKVDVVINELRGLQKKVKAIESITSGAKILWAEKLNIVSDNLPRGVWLRKIILDLDTFYIEGSAIATTANEMSNVHSFTSNLKNNEIFLIQLEGLELGSIQRRKISKVEVADFLLTAQLHVEEAGTE